MAEPVRLNIQSVDGRPLMHKYYPTQAEPAGLVVLLPGDHYGVDAPLLYYPAQILGHRGWDTLSLTYGYQSSGEPLSLAHLPQIVDEIVAGVQAALAYHPTANLLLIGKSLGAALIPSLVQVDPFSQETRTVYLTPPLDAPFFASAFKDTNNKALVILGTADRFYDKEILEDLRRSRSFDLMRIEGADHSLNIEDDLKATLQVLAEVVQRILTFTNS